MPTTTGPGLVHLADLLRPATPGEGTRRIRPPALRRPKLSGRPHPTGEVPAWPTGAEKAITARSELPPVADPPTERLTLDKRPKSFHPRHRQCRCLPITTVVVTGVCTGAITNGVLLAIAWAVTQ